MTFNILSTGSGGNATILDRHILIDCGVSFKMLKPYARELDVVLLTHIHSDHFKPSTVSGLHRRRPALRFACCKWMVEPLLYIGVSPRVIDVLEPGTTYAYQSFFVKPFPLVHNVQNCGYMLLFADEAGEKTEAAIYATDTGSLEGVEAKSFDLYLIEANHKEAELEARMQAKLEAGVFAYEEKAALNHLSYEKALAWCLENAPEGLLFKADRDYYGTEKTWDGARGSLWVPMHPHENHGGNTNGKPHDKGDDTDL